MAEKIGIDTTTAVRWEIPDDVKKKIRKHRLRLSDVMDREVSQEEAAIHMMRVAKVPKTLSPTEQ